MLLAALLKQRMNWLELPTLLAPSFAHTSFPSSPSQVGAFINVQILNDKVPSFPSTSSPSPDVNSEKALQLNCVGHAAALQVTALSQPRLPIASFFVTV